MCPLKKFMPRFVYPCTSDKQASSQLFLPLSSIHCPAHRPVCSTSCKSYSLKMPSVIKSTLLLLALRLSTAAAQDNTCQSFGIDFQDEGSYFQNISSPDPFTFVSVFEGEFVSRDAIGRR